MRATKSLVKDSNKVYYIARVRVVGLNRLKFQVQGDRLNREYGATFEVDCGKVSWVADAIRHKARHDSTFASLHNPSDERYIKCRFRLPSGTNKIRFQMASEQVINRDYGLAFDVYQIGLHKSLKAHIAKYETIRMLDETDKAKPTTMDMINKGMEWHMGKAEWVKQGKPDFQPTTMQIDVLASILAGDSTA